MMRAECLVGSTIIMDHTWPSVKTEPMEIDRNNDSGISPGRTSSEANSNSPQSPGRASVSVQGAYGTPVFYRNGSPPHYGFARRAESPRKEEENEKDYLQDGCDTDDSLERLKMALEKSSALSGIFKSRNEEPEVMIETENSQDGVRKEFPCPLCAYCTPYRHRYVEHLSTHYSDKCTLCDFSGQNAQELRNHLQEAHNLTDIQDLSDPQDNNSDCQDDEEGSGKRGKSKTFKCKQCNYVTATKLDFWEHSKGHIKAEKLLTCPKCPFVTEYKHHLEYHLRNHFGSKPFKCTKCSYSCVNKSMLNSHLKSHSNVYQYRCADCAYATKYCHSLKLHLRKYQHKPAMVLNADGSPNPLPIIDVYGTRRGPKQKHMKEDEKNSFLDLKIPGKERRHDNLPGGIIVPSAPQHVSPPLNNNDAEIPCKFFYCHLCDFHTITPEILQQHVFLHAAESNLAHILKTNNNLQGQMVKEYLSNVYSHPPEPVYLDHASMSPLSLVSPRNAAAEGSPLDLSKQEACESETEAQETKATTKKSRRKGKAYKLERVTESPPQNTPIKIPEFKPTEEKVQEKVEEKADKLESYTCNFCDISFKDIVMYTMHMGYHGYLDPFTCNMCGHVTTDKVAFFLHVARSSHS